MILVINTGSTSLKAKLYNPDLTIIKEFSYSRLSNQSAFTHAVSEIKVGLSKATTSPKYIIHRIVMGGIGAKNGELADEEVMKRLKKYSSLAPLHSPNAIAVIKACQSTFKRTLNVLAYDSAFFAKLPEEEYTLPVNKAAAERLSIRKYGFHGLSHQYMADLISARYDKFVTIHLGAGCSITAVMGGHPIATSMGYTPQGGLMMECRCGDIDPGVVFAIVAKYGLKKAQTILNSDSGLKGVSGTDGSMLDILSLSGNPISDSSYKYSGPNNQYLRHQASLALEMYCQKIKDYIGAYAARMGGLDAIVFSGKIGYGSKFIRDKITFGLDYLSLREVLAAEPDEERTMARIVKDKYY